MWSQSSYSLESGQGCLYLVPTPIGNLQDITYRALEVLRQVDYIAAEDTRHTRKLLHYFQIEKRLVSYHEHNKERSGALILADLEQGLQVALVTDAGMPALADPGEDIVRLALEQRLSVISLPGPNAALPALIASGLPTTPFTFYGFLPRTKKKREAEIESLLPSSATLIFYEAPHRLQATLTSLHKILGERRATLVRELSKKHEEFIRGTLVELLAWVKATELRGEFCLILEGKASSGAADSALEVNPAKWWAKFSVLEHVQEYIHEGLTNKEAIKQVAVDRALPKREVYQIFHQQKET